jgi:hypothetical protein
LLSFRGAFTEAFEPSNLRRLIKNTASCFDHMKFGTFEREFVFLEHGKDISASIPMRLGRGEAPGIEDSSEDHLDFKN